MKNRLLGIAVGLGMLAGVLMSTTGCLVVAAGAGAGAYAFVRGGVDSHLNAPMADCVEAVRETLLGLGLNRIQESSDALSARFVYRDSSDEKVQVRLDSKPNGLVAIKIRIGVVGDKDRSLMILNTIHSNL